MSEQHEDTLAAEDIQARVDALLKEIEAQTKAVEARMSDEQEAEEATISGPVGDEGELDDENLDEQVEQLIERANPPEGEDAGAGAAGEPEAAESPAADATDEDLDQQVDEMLREFGGDEDAGDEAEIAAGDEAGDEKESAPGAPVAASVESAPEAPAEAEAPPQAPAEADDEAPAETMASEPAAESPEVAPEESDEEDLARSLAAAGEGASQAPEPSVSEATEADTLDDALAAEADQTLEGEIEAVELGEEEVAFGDDTALPAEKLKPAAKPEGEEEQPVLAASSDESSASDSRKARRGPGVLARIVAAIVGALHLLSRPLDRLTARQRDTIGWVALNLLFVAACVWLVILLR